MAGIDFFLKLEGVKGESAALPEDGTETNEANNTGETRGIGSTIGHEISHSYVIDPSKGSAASDSASTESFTMNFTEIKAIDETKGGWGASASDDYHDDTSDVGGQTFNNPLADDKTFEPEVDDSEPGPTRPDPTDAGDASGEGNLGGGDIILVDIVGSNATGDSGRGASVPTADSFEFISAENSLEASAPQGEIVIIPDSSSPPEDAPSDPVINDLTFDPMTNDSSSGWDMDIA